MRWEAPRIRLRGEVRAIKRFCWRPIRCANGHIHFLEKLWVVELWSDGIFAGPHIWLAEAIYCSEDSAAHKLRAICRSEDYFVKPQIAMDSQILLV